jgi:hypothetical protein
MASSSETVGVEDAILSGITYQGRTPENILAMDLLGLTKEEPKETTLSLLNATLATALAKGIPF